MTRTCKSRRCRAVNQSGWFRRLAVALPPAVFGRGGTPHQGWARQPGRGVDKPGHPRELIERGGIEFNGGQHPIHIPVEQSCCQWLCAADFGQCKFATGGQLPCLPDPACRGFEESPRQVVCAVGQAIPRHRRFQRGIGHTLPIDRVEAADRLPARQSPRQASAPCPYRPG